MPHDTPGLFRTSPSTETKEMGKSQVPIFVFKTNRGTPETWFFVTEMEQKSGPAQTTHELLTDTSTYFDLVLASTERELSLSTSNACPRTT